MRISAGVTKAGSWGLMTVRSQQGGGCLGSGLLGEGGKNRDVLLLDGDISNNHSCEQEWVLQNSL